MIRQVTKRIIYILFGLVYQEDKHTFHLVPG